MVRVHPELPGKEQAAARAGRPRTSGSSASRTSARSSGYLARNGIADPEVLICASPRRSSAAGCSRVSTSRPSAGSSTTHDIAERKLWDKYMAAYEDMIRAHLRRRRRRGMWCRPTTSGSRGWSIAAHDRRPAGAAQPAIPQGRRAGAGGNAQGPQDADGGAPRPRQALIDGVNEAGRDVSRLIPCRHPFRAAAAVAAAAGSPAGIVPPPAEARLAPSV